MATTIKTTKDGAGTYRATYRGHEIRIIRIDYNDIYGPRSENPMRPSGPGHWNIIIDEACDECRDTKREALATAAAIIDEIEDAR